MSRKVTSKTGAVLTFDIRTLHDETSLKIKVITDSYKLNVSLIGRKRKSWLSTQDQKPRTQRDNTYRNIYSTVVSVMKLTLAETLVEIRKNLGLGLGLVYLKNLEGIVKLSFPQILFQCNLRFVGVNLLVLCFSKVSKIVVRNFSEMRYKESENETSEIFCM